MDDEAIDLLNIALAATDALKRRLDRVGDRQLRDLVNVAVGSLHDVTRVGVDRIDPMSPPRRLHSVGGRR
jgi:hypothetical protein